MISIRHLSCEQKIELMRALWNEAEPTYFHKKFNFDVKLDESFLEISVFHFTDNLCGKLINLDFSKETVDPTSYNNMYGNNKFESILNKYFPDDGTIVKLKDWKHGDAYCPCNRYYGTHYQNVIKNNTIRMVRLCDRCNCPYDN